MKYRAEIDGLRAIAVVSVIFFHAGYKLFSGGFVGVDVFFVISGYLITTILIDDVENKRFSIIKFYERRARRIFPALFFVVLVCIPFAWMWMLPSQMEEFSQSLVAVSLFVSNVLFGRESGYFAAAAEEKPLLHTWSLAVEQQYYILFPIFIVLAWRFGRVRVFWAIVLMAAFSFLLSEWGWRNKPTENFYLAPTRAWELFSGSIAAFIVHKRGVKKDNFLATLGLSAIIFSIFFYDEATPFPSIYALVPVVGVFLLVLYAEKETYVAKLLSIKGFVSIGLISYSAYLWHQPLFAFARMIVPYEQHQVIFFTLTIASFLLAYISWKFIELPFRFQIFKGPTKLFSASIVAFSIPLLFGVGYLDGSLPSRKIDEVTESITPASSTAMQLIDDCFLLNEELSAFNKNCATPEDGKVNILLIGDSHAAALYPGFETLSDVINVDLMSAAYCLPLVTAFPPNSSKTATSRCSTINQQVLETLSTKKYDFVILSAYMYEWGNGGEVWTYPRYYSDFLSQLQIISLDQKIFVLGQVPIWKPSLLSQSLEDLRATGWSQLDDYSGNGIPSDFFQFENAYRSDVQDVGVDYIDVVSSLCRRNQCMRVIRTGNKRVLTSSDYGHIGLEAAQYYVFNLVRPFLQSQVSELEWLNDKALKKTKN